MLLRFVFVFRSKLRLLGEAFSSSSSSRLNETRSLLPAMLYLCHTFVLECSLITFGSLNCMWGFCGGPLLSCFGFSSGFVTTKDMSLFKCSKEISWLPFYCPRFFGRFFFAGLLFANFRLLVCLTFMNVDLLLFLFSLFFSLSGKFFVSWGFCFEFYSFFVLLLFFVLQNILFLLEFVCVFVVLVSLHFS